MKTSNSQRILLAALVGATGALRAGSALASNPLEYPDNGSASFSRGGAWLAVANEPIATHYNPAGLAIQGSGFSIEQQLNFNKVCYDRQGPDGQPEVAQGQLQYLPSCTERSSFPSTIPSISLAGRLSKSVGIGFAIVPPAAYGTADGAFAPTKKGFNAGYQACLERIGPGADPALCGSEYQQIPAPWRYQVLDQFTTILLPTVGIGVEVLPRFRVGAAFISGMMVLNTSVMGVMKEEPVPAGTVVPDHAAEDSYSTLKTKDLFIPGVILSAHWSVTDFLDVAAWGRYISAAESTQGDLDVRTYAYRDSRDPATGAPGLSNLNEVCRQPDPSQNPSGGPSCSVARKAIINRFGNETFRKFRLPFPPEVRAGIRFHLPRSGAEGAAKKSGTVSLGAANPSRDPLKDDVFDVEVDGSYTMNSTANTIEIRFVERNGGGIRPIVPEGFVPPNADRWNGFRDSYGVRIGGQYNVVPERLGLRAGTWFETQSQDDEWMHVGFNGGARGGFGGGLVVRQDFIDISVGYQRHWSSGLDNHGNGRMRANVGSQVGFVGDTRPANLANEPPGVSAADRQQFRTYHTVNNGRITQSAHAFTLGGTIRF